MKRQAMSICLDTLKELEKQIKEEIANIEKSTGLKLTDVNRIGVLMPIINYPTKSGKKKMYCSDTWQFEGVKLKKK